MSVFFLNSDSLIAIKNHNFFCFVCFMKNFLTHYIARFSQSFPQRFNLIQFFFHNQCVQYLLLTINLMISLLLVECYVDYNAERFSGEGRASSEIWHICLRLLINVTIWKYPTNRNRLIFL